MDARVDSAAIELILEMPAPYPCLGRGWGCDEVEELFALIVVVEMREAFGLGDVGGGEAALRTQAEMPPSSKTLFRLTDGARNGDLAGGGGGLSM
jgi:hypothetical protein